MQAAGVARLIVVLGLFAAGAAGCRHRTFKPEPLIVPIELAGPKCGPGGPSVEILRADRKPCGKGDTCTVTDQRLRNPEQRPLWLLLEGDTDFAGYLTSVQIIHPEGQPTPQAWVFSGQNHHTALRLPAGADLVVRNLEYMHELTELDVVFFDRLVLNYDRHIDWTETKGMLPASGELDMDWVGGSITTYEGKDLYPLDGKERVSIGVWCTQHLAVPLPPR